LSKNNYKQGGNKMKLVMRVTITSIFVVFLVTLMSSAWAASYNIEALVELNSDRTQMDVRLTYMKDGKIDPIWSGSLNENQLTAFGERMTLVLNYYLGRNDSRYRQSISPVAISEHGIQAKFVFDEPFTGTHVYIAQACLVGDPTFNSWSPERQNEWMDNIARMSTPPFNWDEAWRIEAPYNGEEDYAGMINRVNGVANPNILVRVSAEGGHIQNPVTPSNSDVVAVAPTSTGADVRALHAALAGVTDTNGKAMVSEVAKSDVNVNTIIPMPVFQVTVSGGQTALMGYETNLNALAERGYKIEDVVFVKLTPNGNVKFTRISNPADVGNGQFAITKAANPTVPLNSGDAIESIVQYLISFGIQDNGAYDWDNTPGNIVDPAAVAAQQAQNGNNGGSSSSSGCNTGFGVVGLLLVGFYLVMRKSRKV
jgi:hypothetical protein